MFKEKGCREKSKDSTVSFASTNLIASTCTYTLWQSFYQKKSHPCFWRALYCPLSASLPQSLSNIHLNTHHSPNKSSPYRLFKYYALPQVSKYVVYIKIISWTFHKNIQQHYTEDSSFRGQIVSCRVTCGTQKSFYLSIHVQSKTLQYKREKTWKRWVLKNGVRKNSPQSWYKAKRRKIYIDRKVYMPILLVSTTNFLLFL